MRPTPYSEENCGWKEHPVKMNEATLMTYCDESEGRLGAVERSLAVFVKCVRITLHTSMNI